MEANRQKNQSPAEKEASGYIYKFLKLFTVIHPGEAVTAFLMALNMFLILTSYYILRPVRQGLILAVFSAESTAYLYAAMAVLFIFFNSWFSRLSSKVPRQKLITVVTLFFISNLMLFYGLYLGGVPMSVMGVVFYIWLGMFNVMIVAQFWAFANDLYTEEAGKRLFPMIMVGQNIGALLGSTITFIFIQALGLYQMMLLSGAILGICICLTYLIHKREIKSPVPKIEELASDKESLKKEQERPLKPGEGFRLVFKSRYLIYIALLILVLNLVNTTGEYIRNHVFVRTADEAIQASTEVVDVEKAKSEFIAKLESGFNWLVNGLAVAIQLLLVSRIFKWFGVRGAILVLPFVALGGYFFIAFGASLVVVRWAKAFENSTDYSLMNACRAALYLVTSREEKYKAKAVIDTFFVRAGDVLTGLFVFLGTTYWALSVEKFAKFNMVVVAFWILLCILIIREHRKVSAQRAGQRIILKNHPSV
jgi:AAA family ATP:ADP antiporter